MILDWKNNKEEALANGISEKEKIGVYYVLMEGSLVENYTFRNFENLEFEEDAFIKNCVFENCGSLTFDCCTLENCNFSHIDTIYAVDTSLNNSQFKELECSNDAVLCLEDSVISHCVFDNITLTNDAYLCDGVGGCLIEECSFSDIKTSRQDREIANCTEQTGFIFKREKQISIIDEDTCTGLDEIEYEEA